MMIGKWILLKNHYASTEILFQQMQQLETEDFLKISTKSTGNYTRKQSHEQGSLAIFNYMIVSSGRDLKEFPIFLAGLCNKKVSHNTTGLWQSSRTNAIHVLEFAFKGFTRRGFLQIKITDCGPQIEH